VRSALLTRLKRLETVQATEERNRRLKVEFAYLKLLPREYSGPRHRLKVGQRPDGRDEYEERPGEPPPNHAEDQDPNVIRLYLVRAHDAADEIDCATDLAGWKTASMA
jgi:hypothetical protein